MTTSLSIEEESGTSTGRRHPHNGYHAGDFWIRPAVRGVPTRTRPAQPTLGTEVRA